MKYEVLEEWVTREVYPYEERLVMTPYGHIRAQWLGLLGKWLPDVGGWNAIPNFNANAQRPASKKTKKRGG